MTPRSQDPGLRCAPFPPSPAAPHLCPQFTQIHPAVPRHPRKPIPSRHPASHRGAQRRCVATSRRAPSSSGRSRTGYLSSTLSLHNLQPIAARLILALKVRPAECTGDRDPYLAVRKGLDDVPASSRLRRRLRYGRAVDARHHHHWHRRCARLYVSQKTQAGLPRHHHVTQHQIPLRHPQGPTSFHRARHCRTPAPATIHRSAFKYTNEGPSGPLVVVDNQHRSR